MAKALTLRVVKAITMLGSTQGLNMVCSVVRMKALSILVGPAGVALLGAVSQAADLITNVTQLNVRTTAVPQMARATPSNFNEILICVHRYGRLLGLVGMLLMFLFAPLLSSYTFGSAEYAWAYRIASLSILFQALQGTELVVLQATSRYQPIAASGLFTAVTGLLLAVPLYWGLRLDGIAPSLVGYSLMAWLGAMWFTRKLRPCGPRPPWRDSLRLGREFIKTGALMTLPALAADGINFIFLGIIHDYGTDALGLYQAGYQIVWRYAAIFFAAFSTEFYPRLSKSITNRRCTSLLLTHQGIITTLLFTPCAAVVIIAAPWLITLLNTSEFIGITPYVVWGMVGMTLRPLSATVSFSFLAAGRAKIFAATEVLSSIIGFAFNIAGLKLLGFTGLGIAVIAWMIADLTIMLAAARMAGAPLPKPRATATAACATAALLTLALIVTF